MRHVLPLLLLSLAACGSDFEPISRLSGLRLMAVAADRPSAREGEQVELRALFHDTEGRSLEWGYALCDAQGSSAALDCLRAVDLSTVTIVRDQPAFVLTMPPLATSTQRDSAVGVAVVVCPGSIVLREGAELPLGCSAGGAPLPLEEFELGVKRIFYEGNTPNRNPTIQALRWDGAEWPEDEVKQVTACEKETDDVSKCRASFRHLLEVDAAGAAEPYQDALGGASQEQAVVQFYSTGGTLEWSARTADSASTRFIARRSDAGKTLTLYVVLRDSRGGVSWQTRRVEVVAE